MTVGIATSTPPRTSSTTWALVLPLGVAEYPIQLADTELVAGEPARVVELLIESCSTLDRLGEHSRLASMAPITAQTLLVLGRLDEVERYAVLGPRHRHPGTSMRTRAR